MKTKTIINHKIMLFIAAMIGAGIFLIIYGWEVLDVTNVSWMANSYGDNVNHYLGWAFIGTLLGSSQLGL